MAANGTQESKNNEVNNIQEKKLDDKKENIENNIATNNNPSKKFFLFSKNHIYHLNYLFY